MTTTNSKYDFNDKVALVTVSSSGIGAAIAIQFAQYGARVTITGRDAANLDKVAKQIELISNGVKPLQIVGDLQDDESLPQKLINQTIEQFGRLDILVNNAGGVYRISKAALDMATKTTALELGPKGIRANSINPELIRTDFLRSRNVAPDDSDRFFLWAEKNSLMRRIGDPADIANLATFLASDEAHNINGAINVSDSGHLINPGSSMNFKPNMYEDGSEA